MKNFRAEKVTIKKSEKKTNKMEKIFANHISDEDLYLYKGLLQLNNKKINNLILKWAKDLNGHFLKEDIQMANKHMKKCSTTLAMIKKKSKTTMSYHFAPTRLAIIKKADHNKYW